MDFFSQQDKARRNTGVLVLLFVIAVLMLIAATNLMVVLTLWGLEETARGDLHTLGNQSAASLWTSFDWQRFLWVGLAVSGVVACAVIYKWVQLADGGRRIAEFLGGSRVHPNSEDIDERRVLNVVEEMAIASGMPVPPVYLLAGEPGINAFAAGHSPADAVIGVTRGTIQSLDREQLQGVIAHEFSHILNGDMRLNLRLMAVLHGIVFIGSMGELLLRGFSGHRHRSYGGSRSKGNFQLVVLGAALMGLGWLGSLFGDLIRSCVSRQREFLADASAVQFTRNPQGIADALKVIGGYQFGTGLQSPNRTEVSHLFFGSVSARMQGLFATHPPLLERILRIEPDWDGNYIYPKPSDLERQRREQLEREERRQARQAAMLGAVLGNSAELTLKSDVRGVERGLDQIPATLREAAKEPLGAMALIFGLLQGSEAAVQAKQRQYLQQSPTPGLLQQLDQVKAALQGVPRECHLPLLELAVPALKCLSPNQYQQFRKRLLLWIRADERIDLYEWCLYQLLTHYLAPEFGGKSAARVRYKRPAQVSEAYRRVVSTLVWHGHNDADDAEKAFNRAAGVAGLYNLRLLPQEAGEQRAFQQAVNTLARATPLLKARLIRGLEKSVRQDGRVTVLEKEILSSIAAVMDCPIPELELTFG